MSEYIITCDEETASWVGNDVEAMRPLVRCRDCKEYRDADATCHAWQWHNWETAIEVEPDGFCAWARRKSEE